MEKQNLVGLIIQRPGVQIPLPLLGMNNFFQILSSFAMAQSPGITPTESRAQALENTVTEPVPVVSSWIDAVGYDPLTQTLDVVMQDAEYMYFGVRPAIAEGMLEAGSKGTYLNTVIKRGMFPYAKVA
jgi:hypothetical protein